MYFGADFKDASLLQAVSVFLKTPVIVKGQRAQAMENGFRMGSEVPHMAEGCTHFGADFQLASLLQNVSAFPKTPVMVKGQKGPAVD